MTTEHHGELLHRLRQLPITAANSPVVADPEVDEPELNLGGYEKAPAMLGVGSFARVYRVASSDPCAHPRWQALKIASAANNNSSGKDNQYETRHRDDTPRSGRSDEDGGPLWRASTVCRWWVHAR